MSQHRITDADRSEVELEERVVKFLRRHAARRYYGKITLAFQAGKVVEVRLEETKKPGELGSEP